MYHVPDKQSCICLYQDTEQRSSFCAIPSFLLSTQPVVEGILAMKGAGGEKKHWGWHQNQLRGYHGGAPSQGPAPGLLRPSKRQNQQWG